MSVVQTTVSAGGTAQTHPVLSLKKLTKRYGDLAAVAGVDLDVLPGEILGLLGPNGSGKSTALNMIMGFVRPTGGSVVINGHDMGRHRQVALASVGGLVEGSAFYPYLSGRRNLEMLARLRRLPRSRVDEVLELVSMGRAASRDFGGYSQGMRQRLGVAAALLHRPSLIVLDEPTSGLDPAGTREMRELLPRLAAEGTTIVLASHLLTEVQQVCERVAILQAGAIVTQGDVDSLLRSQGRWRIRVAPAEVEAASDVLRAAPHTSVDVDDGDLLVESSEAGAELNRRLMGAGIIASELTPVVPTLEAVFMELTGDGEIR